MDAKQVKKKNTLFFLNLSKIKVKLNKMDKEH